VPRRTPKSLFEHCHGSRTRLALAEDAPSRNRFSLPRPARGGEQRTHRKGVLNPDRLEEGKFICVIPRLRYAPYYRVRNVPRASADDIRDAINNRTTGQDHAKLREMIASCVNNTGNKVMACAEMTYQVELAKEVLVDPLPAEIRKNVVWRDTYWLPDEAASIYSKAAAEFRGDGI